MKRLTPLTMSHAGLTIPAMSHLTPGSLDPGESETPRHKGPRNTPEMNTPVTRRGQGLVTLLRYDCGTTTTRLKRMGRSCLK